MMSVVTREQLYSELSGATLTFLRAASRVWAAFSRGDLKLPPSDIGLPGFILDDAPRAIPKLVGDVIWRYFYLGGVLLNK